MSRESEATQTDNEFTRVERFEMFSLQQSTQVEETIPIALPWGVFLAFGAKFFRNSKKRQKHNVDFSASF